MSIPNQIVAKLFHYEDPNLEKELTQIYNFLQFAKYPDDSIDGKALRLGSVPENRIRPPLIRSPLSIAEAIIGKLTINGSGLTLLDGGFDGNLFEIGIDQWLWVDTSGRLRIKTSGGVPLSDTDGLVVGPTSASAPKENYVVIEDQKSSGTGGGTFTSGAWRTRDLNTEVTDTDALATLSSNQVTLQPGKWWFGISAPAWSCLAHQTRLRNITDSTTDLLGTSEHSSLASDQTSSFVQGRISFSAAKAFEVQHQCGVTSPAFGFGNPGSLGTEVYTVFQAWKFDE